MAPEEIVYQLAGSVSYDVGVFVEPLAVAVQAMNCASDKDKNRTAVIGIILIFVLFCGAMMKRGKK